MKRTSLFFLFLFSIGIHLYAEPTDVTVEKTLEYGEVLVLDPWIDFYLSHENRPYSMMPYGESITWYVDGKYCDEEVFSVSRHTSSGDSHPWGELTNYPYQLATYLIKANEGQVGLHVFSVRLHFLYLWTDKDGIKHTTWDQNGNTIKYNIQLPEPYVVLSNDNTTLTFYFDTKKKERNGMDIGPQVYNEPWINYRNNITTVIFDDSFANYDGLTSTAYWFYSCSNLSTISGIQNLNTSKVNDMSSMFQGCRKLETLDLSSFNTENVTDMSFMFMGCNKLTTLDVSNFNTQNVTNMLNMFYECYTLRALDVSKFNTQNVTKMDQMFSSCISLTALDVSKFDTKNVTDMSSMFSGCNALTVLDVSKFDTKNVTDMSSMFSGCNALTALNVSNFDTQNVTNMLRMFHECKSLTALDVSNFNTKDVTRMDEMFAGCNSLATLDVSKFDTQNVTNMYGMFSGCHTLTSLDVSKFDTQNVTNMYGMFSGCHTLTSLDVSKFDTQNVTNMGCMFEDCNSLVTLDVSKFDTRNVTNMKFMFDGCKSLNTLCLTNINTKNVTTMEHMFYECESLTTLDISMFNTQNVTNMFRMFWGCKALKILDLSNFNTNKVTKMSYMFYWCDSLTTIYSGPNWSTRNVTDGEDMFGCCEKLIGGQGTKYDYKHTDFTYAHIDGGVVNPGYFTEKTTIINITFADPVVKAICVSNWDTDGDGELSEAEAAAVESLNNAFFSNQEITSFDELQYFTGLTAINGDFYSCRSLTSIIIPENVTTIGLYNGWGGAFAWCYDLTSVTLGDKVKTIGDRAFQGCSLLSSINIPHGVETIGIDAFSGCSALPSLIIPSSVEYIHDGAFDFCSGLTSIVVDEGNRYYDSRENCNALIATQYNTLIVGSSNSFIPNTVTSISRLAFRFRNGLNSLTIPKSVTRIGNEAFAGCVGLNYIIVEEGNPTYDSRDNCNAIIETAKDSLINGSNNTIIPHSVKKIAPFAFQNCSDLTSLTIPSSITSIGESAFNNCAGPNLLSIMVEEGNPTYDSRDNCNAIIETETNSLLLGCKNTIFPDNVMVIGPFAFRGCSDMTSIRIPNSVRSIEESAFYECSGLSSVVIGKSVEMIGAMAFYCPNLQDVYCYADNVPNAWGQYGNDAFRYSNIEGATLHVPASSVDAYSANDIWKKFGSIVALQDNDPKPTGIRNVNNDIMIGERYYSLDGKRLAAPQRGINIVKMGDGTTRKIVVK